MAKLTTHQLSLSPRMRALWWIVLTLFGVFALRLFYIQVVQHAHYVEAARERQVTKLTIFPERGTLYTKDGETVQPLVLNETVYTVFADPKEVKDPEEVRVLLRQVAGGELDEDALGLLSKKDLRYVVLARQVSRTQAEMIQKKALDGVGLQRGTRRVYPEGALAAQLLGYVNNDGKGQYGLEEALDKRLAGTEGMLQSVTDVRRIPLTIGDDNISQPAIDGDDIVLSVDRSIQLKAEQVLQSGLANAKATRGSVVVMNPNNGQVLAMANLPSYSPADYTKVEDYSLFQNSVVSYPYENGSVIKTFTVGAGLDTGAVTTESTFPDGTGCYQMSEWPQPICNVEEDPKKAAASMLDTLRYSLNTGVVYVLRQMGGGTINDQAKQQLYRYFHDKYRFAQLTGIEQAGETTGVMIAPDDQEGSSIRYANMAFGQGMNTTMIQTTAAFSAMINGGTYYKPTLVAGTYKNGNIAEQQPTVVEQNMFTTGHSAEIRDLIWQGRKTGFFGRYDRDGYKIGGKTGTSQVIDPKTGKYSNENSVGSYLGFGGAETPEYVIMVRVDDAKIGGYAGTTAAGPIFNELSNWLLDYLHIQPSAG